MKKEKRFVVKAEKGQKITRVKISDDGKSLVCFTEVDGDQGKVLSLPEDNLNEKFPIVDIEGISEDDEFLSFIPQDSNGKRIKESIFKAKKEKMKNFRISAIDPSLDNDKEKIIFEEGHKPAVGKSYFWWRTQASKFCYKKNSRLISTIEMDVFLGNIIKYLYENKGYKIEQAWYAVCCNSKRLGHYYNAEKAKSDFEKTGKRKIGTFFDLANTSKIAYDPNTESFFEYGGAYTNNSKTYPLAYIDNFSNVDKPRELSVGKIVMDI